MNPLAAAATTIPTPHPPLAAASACRQAKPASGSRGRLAHILRWSVGMCVLLRVEVVVPALHLLLVVLGSWRPPPYRTLRGAAVYPSCWARRPVRSGMVLASMATGCVGLGPAALSARSCLGGSPPSLRRCS